MTWQTHSDVNVSKGILSDWVSKYEDDLHFNWAIEYEGRVIGSIAAGRVDESVESVHIGYCIGRRWWRQGITTEALRAVIRYMFECVLANRVDARFDPKNPNSGAVMKKCSMTYEGTLRMVDRNNSGICDASYYGILRSEWLSLGL